MSEECRLCLSKRKLEADLEALHQMLLLERMSFQAEREDFQERIAHLALEIISHEKKNSPRMSAKSCANAKS